MTRSDLITGHEECGDDVAAYALGALEPADADRFERHLKDCALCPDELRAFEQVIEALPMSAPGQPAPAGLRRRVLRAIADEPVRPARSARPARRMRSLRRRSWPLIHRPIPAFGAVLALAALAFAVVTVTTSSSPAARVIHAQVRVRGTAEVRITNGHGELVLEHFSPPPAGQIYEVWFARGRGAPTPANVLFSVTTGGEADVFIPREIRGVRTLTVTSEPAGGTRRPTHPSVLRAVLS